MKSQPNNGTKPANELLTLKPRKVKLQQLYLDPNNPRLGTARNTPDSRVVEDGIQQGLQSDIEKKIGIEDLNSSIQRHGFAPTDPVVVRHLFDDKFVVLEGNRRVATLKKLFRAHQRGDINLGDELLASIENPNVLVYEGNNPDIVWIVQGLRHMSGIKEWPPLQQAAFIAQIEHQLQRRNGSLDSRPTPQAIAKAAGVRADVAGRLLRSYHAFQQARKDDEYGESIKDDKFSIFNEAIFKVETLQTWLGWDDNTRRFQKVANLRKFLSWITPPEAGGDPRIIRALDVRDVLPQMVNNPDLLTRFESESLNIDQARVELAIEKGSSREPNLDSVRDKLSTLLNSLDSLPGPKIKREDREGEFRDLLMKLRQSLEYQIDRLG